MTLFLKMEAGGLLSVRAHKVHCETLSTHTPPPKKNKNREGGREKAGREVDFRSSVTGSQISKHSGLSSFGWGCPGGL